jgi:hypothetical protein
VTASVQQLSITALKRGQSYGDPQLLDCAILHTFETVPNDNTAARVNISWTSLSISLADSPIGHEIVITCFQSVR